MFQCPFHAHYIPVETLLLLCDCLKEHKLVICKYPLSLKLFHFKEIEMINNIEKNITNAADCIEHAKKEA